MSRVGKALAGGALPALVAALQPTALPAQADSVATDTIPAAAAADTTLGVGDITGREGDACRTMIAFGSNRPEGPGIYLAAPEGGTPTRLIALPGALQIEWSPDGSRIAFLSVTDEDRELFAPYQGLRFHALLYVMNADGSDLRRVSDAPATKPFAWSPDGTRIAFASSYETEEGRAAIYVADSRGGGPSRITELDGLSMFPAWSPDGRLMAYASKRGDNSSLNVLDLERREPEKVVEVGSSRALRMLRPVWAPTGRLLAFSDGKGAFVVGLTGGDPTRFEGGTGEPLRWSPGRSEFLMAEPPDDTARGDRRSTVYLYEIESNERRQLAVDAGAAGESSPSPSWDRVAYTAIVDGQADVVVVPADGGSSVNLTTSPANDYFPAWSPCLSAGD